jgi:toxin ParE1/3/4
MAVRAIDIHPLALKELQSAYRWYAQRSPRAAQRFQGALGTVVQWIATAPERGSLYRQRYRWKRLRGFPYLVYYEIRDPQRILIYAIAHGRRRPVYWKTTLSFWHGAAGGSHCGF